MLSSIQIDGCVHIRQSRSRALTFAGIRIGVDQPVIYTVNSLPV